MLATAGHLVGSIPAAADHGLGSPAGHRLIVALAITGVAYAAALLLGPVQSSLSSVVKWRLVDPGRRPYAELYELQARAYR